MISTRAAGAGKTIPPRWPDRAPSQDPPRQPGAALAGCVLAVKARRHCKRRDRREDGASFSRGRAGGADVGCKHAIRQRRGFQAVG